MTRSDRGGWIESCWRSESYLHPSEEDLRLMPLTPGVTTMEHVWAEIWVIPVEVMPDPDGGPDPLVVRTTSKIQQAEANAKLGCLSCGVSLDSGYNTDCKGPKELHDQER